MNSRGFSGVEGIKRAIRGLVMILAPLFVMPSCIESGRLDDITTRTVLILPPRITCPIPPSPIFSP